MPLTLYYHPLSSFCWKALIALYELEVPFTPLLVDLQDEKSRADFLKIWPLGKFPVLKDGAGGRVVPESTPIIEYLSSRHAPASRTLIPADPDRAFDVRLADRVYDLHVHQTMQRIVGDRLRPAERRDPVGVEDDRARLSVAYALLDGQMAARPWAAGDAFTLADCAAFPALHYANEVHPFVATHGNLARYLERLRARPSVARVLREAEPYLAMFPRE
jgi:glutathione S-transferase